MIEYIRYIIEKYAVTGAGAHSAVERGKNVLPFGRYL